MPYQQYFSHLTAAVDFRRIAIYHDHKQTNNPFTKMTEIICIVIYGGIFLPLHARKIKSTCDINCSTCELITVYVDI